MPDLFPFALSPTAEDALITAALAAVPVLTGALVLRGYRPFAVIRAMLRRAAGTAALFVALIAVALALGLILTAQERGLRQASARAADPFDVVVAAPGSEVTAMLAAVYLQPADIPLLTGAQMAEIAATPGVRLAAPVGFGDSVDGLPVVGTTAALVEHVAGPMAEGRLFAARGEVVIGAHAPFALGAELEPAHGTGPDIDPDDHSHAGEHLTVVGRMAPTGGPWDRAVITPIETLWQMHGLPDGHAAGAGAANGAMMAMRATIMTPGTLTTTTTGPRTPIPRPTATTTPTMSPPPQPRAATVTTPAVRPRTATHSLTTTTTPITGITGITGIMRPLPQPRAATVTDPATMPQTATHSLTATTTPIMRIMRPPPQPRATTATKPATRPRTATHSPTTTTTPTTGIMRLPPQPRATTVTTPALTPRAATHSLTTTTTPIMRPRPLLPLRPLRPGAPTTPFRRPKALTPPRPTPIPPTRAPSARRGRLRWCRARPRW